MCGLFGFIGKSPNNDILNELGELASKRGPDGWGLYDGKSYSWFLGDYQPQDYTNAKIVLGHCRLHTIIGTSKSLGHLQPMTSPDLILCFNGSVKNYPDTYSSDTRYLHDLISEKGLAKALKISKMNKYSLVYYDKLRGEVKAAVSGISLYMGKINGDTYWCSKKFISSKKINGIITLWQR